MSILSRFRREDGGSAAVEFAIIAVVMITTLVFILIMGLIVYLKQSLDSATSRAARQVMVGSTQSGSVDQATFKQQLCNYLPAAFQCSDVIVNLYIVEKKASPGGYLSYVKSDMTGLKIPDLTSGSGQYSLGGRGEYQYLQVIYPMTMIPNILLSAFDDGTRYNGKPAFLAISTAAFRNEQF